MMMDEILPDEADWTETDTEVEIEVEDLVPKSHWDLEAILDGRDTGEPKKRKIKKKVKKKVKRKPKPKPPTPPPRRITPSPPPKPKTPPPPPKPKTPPPPKPKTPSPEPIVYFEETITLNEEDDSGTGMGDDGMGDDDGMGAGDGGDSGADTGDETGFSEVEIQMEADESEAAPGTMRSVSQWRGGDWSSIMSNLANAMCTRCRGGFGPYEKMVNSNGELYHEKCFVCAQCFQPFPDGLFYEFEGRKYCEHDFHMLYAPCCGQCGEFVIGRVIKAMNNNWHPDCFTCHTCHAPLADTGFVKNAGRALCRPCNARERASGLGKYICQKCHQMIEDKHLIFKSEPYHPYHFNCHHCGKELTEVARELRGELYCLPCHDKMGIPICGACRRPIETRVVNALGKQWHVEHFVCAKCEKPFLGHRHYERKGLAYCETHYNQLFGDVCYCCNKVITGDVVSALNKSWCVACFACSICDQKLTLNTKFLEFDMKPVCKACFVKFPMELKKRYK
ncbi:LIM and senescent cell antigen-like-containing domain protein 1 isoform X3 [Branchiostoma floridae]|uniref:LIM and senescent cell antigen-like-containing domain protein 2 n=1 Tax=Branchiostoma floridae TaxID=7739 RepID=A0A9J7N7V6_BRAFL|nr:LIM and senescent cell antigen-like-containing domain protein 1 isoform X3 [Branchiostoma floridae]XP_035692896.1 LIM and senescent cell antigen-like-containing domain protein 1 isoform X3 [Branchiostoma floridae]